MTSSQRTRRGNEGRECGWSKVKDVAGPLGTADLDGEELLAHNRLRDGAGDSVRDAPGDLEAE